MHLKFLQDNSRAPLPIPENLVITWPYTDLPPTVRPHTQGNQCLFSHFLASLAAQEKTNCTSMLWSTDSCQNKASLTSINWPHRGLKCRPIEVEYFLKLSADKLPVSNDRRLKFFFQWFISNVLCLFHYRPALLGYWFQTDLGRENSASFF